MTDKEAIEVLKDLWRWEHPNWLEKDIRQALEKGINALEKQAEIVSRIEAEKNKLNVEGDFVYSVSEIKVFDKCLEILKGEDE